MFDHVAEDEIKSLRCGRALETFCEFGTHARVLLDCYYALGLFEYFRRQVACSWTDFQHDIGLLEVGLINDCLCHTWVLEDVLSEVFVEFEDVVYRPRSAGTAAFFACCCSMVGIGFMDAITTFASRLGHIREWQNAPSVEILYLAQYNKL